MSKMRSSISRIFGRKKRATELAARLESTISAGKAEPEGLSAIRSLAEELGQEKRVNEVMERPETQIRNGLGQEVTLDVRPEPVPTPRNAGRSSAGLSALEMRDLVASLPELDVHDLASSSRQIAELLRKQNQRS